MEKHNYGFAKKINLRVDNVIIGILRNHDNMRGGIGPGQGFSAWTATKLIEVSGNVCYEVYRKTGKRKALTAQELMTCWKHTIFVEPKSYYRLDDHDMVFRLPVELALEEEAMEAVYLEYEELHDVTFPWKAMKYRKPRTERT